MKQTALGNVLSRLIGEPQVSTDRFNRSHRHVTRFELLYDLAYATGIAQLTAYLSVHSDTRGLLVSVFLLLPIWWSWTGHTLFANRFVTEGPLFAWLSMLQMLAATTIALVIFEAFDASSLTFAAAYIVNRAALWLMYRAIHYAIPPARPVTRMFLIGFGLGIGIWIISLFLPAPIRPYVWLTGLLAELATPWLAHRILSRVSVHSDHLIERFSLFTIIIFGEAFLGIIRELSSIHLGFEAAVGAVVAFALVMAMTWFYFSDIHRIISGRDLKSGQQFIYFHLIIYAGLISAIVGLEHAVLAVAHGAPDRGAWMLPFGLATMIVGFSAIKVPSFKALLQIRFWYMLAVSVGTLAVLAAFSQSMRPFVFLAATGIFFAFFVAVNTAWSASQLQGQPVLEREL